MLTARPGVPRSARTPGHNGRRCAGTRPPRQPSPGLPGGLRKRSPGPAKANTEPSPEPLLGSRRKPPPARSDAVALGFSLPPRRRWSQPFLPRWEQNPPPVPPREAAALPSGPSADPGRTPATLDAASAVPVPGVVGGDPTPEGVLSVTEAAMGAWGAAGPKPSEHPGKQGAMPTSATARAPRGRAAGRGRVG